MWLGIQRADLNDGTSPFVWIHEGSDTGINPGINPNRFTGYFLFGASNALYDGYDWATLKQLLCKLQPVL